MTDNAKEFSELAIKEGAKMAQVKQEDLVSTNDISAPQPDMAINYHQNENEIQVKLIHHLG